jgi:hypothetical protein
MLLSITAIGFVMGRARREKQLVDIALDNWFASRKLRHEKANDMRLKRNLAWDR